ncbi:MAG: hypothetical protein ACRDWH_06485 [Acidimicrobiia bacterium]
MFRWLRPRSRSGRIAVQVLLLGLTVGVVYLLVMALGAGLGLEPTPP